MEFHVDNIQKANDRNYFVPTVKWLKNKNTSFRIYSLYNYTNSNYISL